MSNWYISAVEWYPVYILEDFEVEYSGTAEFSDDELADIRHVSSEFNRIQKLIAERFSGHLDYVEEQDLISQEETE